MNLTYKLKIKKNDMPIDGLKKIGPFTPKIDHSFANIYMISVPKSLKNEKTNTNSTTTSKLYHQNTTMNINPAITIVLKE